MQENIDSDRRYTPLTCTTRRLFPCRSIPGVSPQVPTVEGTVTALTHVHGLFMGRTEWLFIEAPARVAVGVSEAFSSIVVLQRRNALATARGEAQSWW